MVSGQRLRWSPWKVFWPDGVQHRRKGGDLTAGLIDLLCCRSVFSLLAGSDPETPHAHAHACKTHHENICKHSGKTNMIYPSCTIMPILYWVQHTCKYRQRRETRRNNSAVSQTGVFEPDVHSVTHNLWQDVKLNKHTLFFFNKEEKWIRHAAAQSVSVLVLPPKWYHTRF